MQVYLLSPGGQPYANKTFDSVGEAVEYAITKMLSRWTTVGDAAVVHDGTDIKLQVTKTATRFELTKGKK